VFSLEGNQGHLHGGVPTFFTSPLAPAVASVSYDGGHGRIETRSIRATADIAWLQERHDWKGLQSIVAVTAKKNSITRSLRKHAISSAAWMPMIQSDWSV
jgi:hypothetical protein